MVRQKLEEKLYAPILLSPNGMSGETMEVAIKYEQIFRGDVIIGKCGVDGKSLRIDPRLANKIPKEFERFCRL